METQDKFLDYLNREIAEWRETKNTFLKQGKLTHCELVENKLSVLESVREVYKSHL